MRVASGPDPPGSSRCVIERRRTPVPHVCLSATLTTPAPSGSTDTSWLCQGCSHPRPAPPGAGCPQLHRPAATGRRRRSLTSYSINKRLTAHRRCDAVSSGAHVRALGSGASVHVGRRPGGDGAGHSGPEHDGDVVGDAGAEHGRDHGVAVAVDDRHRHVAGGEVLQDGEPVAQQGAHRVLQDCAGTGSVVVVDRPPGYSGVPTLLGWAACRAR